MARARLTYAAWLADIARGGARARAARARARRPSRAGPAEPARDGDAALGVPACGRDRDAAQLARQGRRDRVLPRRHRGEGGGVRAGLGGRRLGAAPGAELPRIGVGGGAGTLAFAALIAERAGAARRAPGRGFVAHALHLGHDRAAQGRAAPAPRRARRRLAHVAQNLYARGERTLGVMPLYHTMGVRSLLAMALLDGCFVCQPPLRCRRGAGPDRARAGDEPLSRADALSRSAGAPEIRAHRSRRRCRKLGFAGAAMPDGLMRRVVAGSARPLRQPLRLVRDLHLHRRARRRAQAGLGRQGRAQRAHPRRARSAAPIPTRAAPPGEEGQIIAELSSDEAFEGYWRRPDADARALHARLVLHRRYRLFRCAMAISSSPAASTT